MYPRSKRCDKLEQIFDIFLLHNIWTASTQHLDSFNTSF